MVYDLQKASMWKRIAAWLFDSILIVILVVGVAFLLSTVLGYDQYSDSVNEGYARYEEMYGVTFDVTQEEYLSWTEETRQRYDTAYQELAGDEEVLYAYNMVVNLTMVITSLSILAAVLLLEFVVPLLFKDGRTIGKKIFSLCVVRTDCVKMTTVQLFVRTILGKYVVETMIPVYLLLMLFWGITDLSGTLVLLVLLLAVILVPIVTRRHAAIHDLLAGTAVADFASQTIFGSTEELLEVKKKIHAEQAARQDY